MSSNIYRNILIIILASAGIAHFVFGEYFVPAVPKPFDPALTWVYITGAIEILAVFGLLSGKLRKLTSYLVMFYLIALIPAHIKVIIDKHELLGFFNKEFFIVRLFMQAIPIFIAWQARKSSSKSILPILDKIDELLAKRWSKPKAFQSKWLWAAAWYNIAFGYWVVVHPEQSFLLFGLEPSNYDFVWQTVGMVVGVYGIGYAVAAFDEMKHWPIVLVGLLGKIFGPIGFVQNFLEGDLPLQFGSILIFNDLIWWYAFFSIIISKIKEE